jgi:hypothetical protein
MNKIIKLLAIILLSLSLSGFLCENKEEDEESRLYLEEDSPNYFTELYVVPSPQGSSGNWGSNIVGNYEILSGYGWKKYTFDPGTYDIKIQMHITKYSSPHTEYGQIATDGHGRKFEADPDGDLWMTDFAFEH